jgi:hypothetical protein
MSTAQLARFGKHPIRELAVPDKDRDRVEHGTGEKANRKQKKIAASIALRVTTSSAGSRIVPLVVFSSALAVAAVSGSFSIVGLTAVFTGAFWAIIAMGIALEVAKLSAVAWLGRSYKTPRTLKAAIVTLVATLMGLNFIGAYGFLARAHLEHVTAGEAAVSIRQADVDARRQAAVATLTDFDRRIAQVDDAVAESTRRGHAVSAMTLAERQAARRTELVAARGHAATDLVALQVEGAAVTNQRNGLATDTGPVLYLSKLIGIDQEAATRWFVFMVAVLLDPLALTLLLAASAQDTKGRRRQRANSRRQ